MTTGKTAEQLEAEWRAADQWRAKFLGIRDDADAAYRAAVAECLRLAGAVREAEARQGAPASAAAGGSWRDLPPLL